jgi:phosphoribosylanthranilate isomerase
MWIKICANTNLEDAQLAATLGADALGFVFAPSKRHITVAEVAKITPHLPANIERIGVFPALDADQIARDAQAAGLTGIQLHGGVDLALIRQLHKITNGKITLIQAVHWNVETEDITETNATTIAHQLRDIAADGLVDRVLIDSKIGAASGGTGTPFNWEAARTVLTDPSSTLKLIVAGGLHANNVDEAIQRLAPWGVDVASGVEAELGKKSPERLAAFIRKARATKLSAS